MRYMPDSLDFLSFYLWHAVTGLALAQGVGEFRIDTWHWRTFYRLKAVFCLLLGWEMIGLPPTADPHLDGVVVAIPSGGVGWSEHGTQYWGEYLIVGHSLRRHWWFCIIQDST